MIYDVFSIFDSKAEAYLPPFILPNEAMAKRVFADCVNSDTHQFSHNPDDYTLFRLGQFDDSSGQYLLERAKHSLGNGVEFMRMDLSPATEGRSNGKETTADSGLRSISNGPPIQPGTASEDSPE